MIRYQEWNNGEIIREFHTLDDAIKELTGQRSVSDAVQMFDRSDSRTHYLLEIRKGKKMDISTLLLTGSESLASNARLNHIKSDRQKQSYKAYTFRLNKETDYGMIAYLASKENFNEYIRKLIEDDFEKILYPVDTTGVSNIHATVTVRRLMVILELTPFQLSASTFEELYPFNKYGIKVINKDGNFYAYHKEDPEERRSYQPLHLDII